MKPLAILSVMALFGSFGIAPLAGHDCDHHSDDRYDCGRHHSQGSQAGQNSGSRGTAAALQTLKGKIIEVIYLPGSTVDDGMVEIRVQSPGQAKLVRLAPSGFLKQQGVLLREGDAVSITGFAVAGMDGDLIGATEVHAGDRALSLRDTRGRPVW